MSIQPLTRRSTLRGLAISAGAAVVGFAVARSRRSAVTSRAGAANEYGAEPASGQLLAPLDEVPPGGGLVVRKARVVLVRGSDDTVHAFSAICTHQGCPVDSVTGGVISCPCHGSKFDAGTGAVVAGPATRPLPTVAVSVHNGGVYTS